MARPAVAKGTSRDYHWTASLTARPLLDAIDLPPTDKRGDE
jgi:hypothetical protein